MSTELIVNSTPKGDRIALLKNKALVEYHFESADSKFNVGDIFLGTVRRLMPGLNAAFVDIGYEKDAFLHYHDLGPNFKTLANFIKSHKADKSTPTSLSGFKFEPELEKYGKISQIVKSGQKILVQVIKEPISSKGPRISCDISLAGRFIVLVPFSNVVSISKKIAEKEERIRLKEVISSIKPKNFGVIVRTAASYQKLEDLDNDLRSILRVWYDGVNRLNDANSKDKLIGEISRTSGLLRDMLNDTFDSIQVDTKILYDDIRNYVESFAPNLKGIVKLHNNKKTKIFEALGVEKQIKTLFGKTVNLPSGGYLIIEQTEALFVIDVNSGNIAKTKGQNQEDTSLKVNLEAAEEISKQLRLRDIGGIIVIDFIDMKSPEGKKLVYDNMKKLMKEDRSKHTILPISKFGLMQITRQRVRPIVNIKTNELCPSCNGTGKITASILVSDKINKTVEHLILKQNEKKITLFLHPFLFSHFTKGILSKQVRWLFKYKRWVNIYKDSSLPITEFKLFNKEGEEIDVSQQF